MHQIQNFPLGELTALPRSPGGEGLAAPSPRTPPRFALSITTFYSMASPMGLQSLPRPGTARSRLGVAMRRPLASRPCKDLGFKAKAKNFGLKTKADNITDWSSNM